MLDKHNVSEDCVIIILGKEVQMEFMNREAELTVLSGELAKPQSRLIVLYGRRRIGKSALLQRLLGPDSVYYLADINEAEVQRAFFSRQLSEPIPGFDRITYPDWNSFFEQANRLLKKRVTVFIDEFPYLVRSSPELPSVLQKIIDLGHNSMFHLVLCGSYQQMMQGLVLDKSAPLFGRAHRIMQLQPMSCGWLKAALGVNALQAIEEYSVWGGIPRNWELRSEYESLDEALRALILEPWGVLHEEPLRLFMDDLKSAVQPISIASLIGQGCNKLSEIAARLNKPATNLNRPLQSMIDTGYIKRDTCWGESGKSSKKTLYRLLDPISRFYFSFVIPNQSRLSSGMIDSVNQDIINRWKLYVSETWEELCRQSVTRLQIDGLSFLPAQRWWQQSKSSGHAEIDIIAESTDGENLLVGEAKWQQSGKPGSVLNDLEQKISRMELKKRYRQIYRLVMLPVLSEKTDKAILYRDAEFVCSR